MTKWISYSFCCVTKWISYTYTYIPISPPSCISLPPSLSHPSRWSQSTQLISLCYCPILTHPPRPALLIRGEAWGSQPDLSVSMVSATTIFQQNKQSICLYFSILPHPFHGLEQNRGPVVLKIKSGSFLRQVSVFLKLTSLQEVQRALSFTSFRPWSCHIWTCHCVL